MRLIKYSYSKLDDANYCTLRYYLRWIEGFNKFTTPAFVKGSLFHESMEHFWEKLGTKEEVSRTRKKKGGKKYSDADDFADYLSRKWTSLIIGAEHSERQLDWDYPKQQYLMKQKISEIAFYLFPHLIEREKPLYSEISFKFILGHRRFTGRMDEVRLRDGKVVVSDFKSGTPRMGDIKKNHDIQMTMYNVGIGALCYANEEFAKSLGLEKERKSFFGHPKFVNENIEHEFVMLEAPYVKQKLLQMGKTYVPEFSLKTFRKENHFYEILKMLDGLEASIKHGIVYPQTGHKCDYCVMKKICKERLESLVSEVPLERNGQAIFSFASPIFKLPVEKEEIEPHQLGLFEGLVDKLRIKKHVRKARKSLITKPS